MFGIRELKERIKDLENVMSQRSNHVDRLHGKIDACEKIIIELKSRLIKSENPQKYKIGQVVDGVTISDVDWYERPKYDTGFGPLFPMNTGWYYYGVKKGSDKLIEVK